VPFIGRGGSSPPSDTPRWVATQLSAPLPASAVPAGARRFRPEREKRPALCTSASPSHDLTPPPEEILWVAWSLVDGSRVHLRRRPPAVSQCWDLVTVGAAAATLCVSSGTSKSVRRVDDRGRLSLGQAEQQALGEGPVLLLATEHALHLVLAIAAGDAWLRQARTER
jgi:hypothetical protein